MTFLVQDADLSLSITPAIVDISTFHELDNYIRQGIKGGLIINFTTPEERAYYNTDAKYILTIYNDWIE